MKDSPPFLQLSYGSPGRKENTPFVPVLDCCSAFSIYTHRERGHINMTMIGSGANDASRPWGRKVAREQEEEAGRQVSQSLREKLRTIFP